jgi:putative flippase GtrA
VIRLRVNARQLLLFGVVGGMNTVGDFAIFDLLYGVFHLPWFWSNAIAVTIMMGISLQLNRKFVFGDDGKGYGSQAWKFALVTISGLYILQNAVLAVTLGAVESMHLTGMLGNHLLQINFAKAVGVGASAVWDFALYKLWVFKAQPDQPVALEPEE